MHLSYRSSISKCEDVLESKRTNHTILELKYKLHLMHVLTLYHENKPIQFILISGGHKNASRLIHLLPGWSYYTQRNAAILPSVLSDALSFGIDVDLIHVVLQRLQTHGSTHVS